MTSVNEVIESGIFSAATRLGSWSEWITPRNLGPVTSASLDVSNAQLHRLFTVNTVSRGRGYAMQGMVVEHKWTGDGLLLTGLCRGSGGQRYRQNITFRDQPTLFNLVHAMCTCPVGSRCKHSVALLITAARSMNTTMTGPAAHLQLVRDVPAPAPTWRTAIASILDGDEPTSASARAVRPLALSFGASGHRPGQPVQVLTLRPMITGSRDNWIKTGASWRDVAVGYMPEAQPAQVAALKQLYRHVTGGGYAAARDYLTLVAPPLGWLQILAEAVNAGVTLLADPSLCTRQVRLGTAELRYSVSEHPEGATLVSTTHIDGTPVAATNSGTFGRPEVHGMWSLTEDALALGSFPAPVREHEVQTAREGTEILIPTADLDEFSADVLPRLQVRRPVQVADGVLAPPVITGPEAVLTVTDTNGGARYYWSVGYRVNDTHVVFDPTADAGSTSYRDARAETALWDEIRDDMGTLTLFCGTWQQQATAHLLTALARSMDDDLILEQERISPAPNAADAAHAASNRVLCAPVRLTPTELAVICGEALPELRLHPRIRVDYQCGTQYRAASASPTVAFTADETAGNDWFSLEVTVTVGAVAIPITELITELSCGATHMLLTNGEYFSLDSPELAALAELLVEARSLGEIESGRVNARSLNATFWEELLALGTVDEQLARWRKRMAKLSAAKPPRTVAPSRRLKAELRDYQQNGLNWLTFLWKNRLGGILADDMGLGKTVQTLALIARAVDAKRTSRFLVIAPTSVVPNWVAECQKFVPGLRVSSITATEARTGLTVAEHVGDAHVVVTSYTLLRLLFDDIDAYTWDGVIFDEAQFIKNHNGKTHQCARRIDSEFKLAITGTPMENNLMELWSLLSVTAPGLFSSPTAFTDYYRKPIESNQAPERLETLRRRIKPVMLRRTKSQVAVDLPPKQEQSMVLDLAGKHRKIYDTRLARERQKVLGLLGDWEKNRFQVFRSLSMLRQLSLHAALVDSSHDSVNSAKVDYLIEQLPGLVDEGHSSLVFSQFTGFLDILRAHLDAEGIVYSYLDGSMSAKQRAAAVQRFRSGAAQVFLISLKAGGFGLNLTEADYCFVCDPWWNPAAEAQAVDRAHRIGQQRPVNVYRLVSADTIEERVVRLQERKRALFDAVVDDGELFGSAISAADIREMLA